jgi:hypothetical protein
MNVTKKRYFTAEDAEDRRGKHNQLINSSAILYAGTAVHFWLHPIAKRYRLRIDEKHAVLNSQSSIRIPQS